MSAGKIIGGILALVGGFLVLIQAFINIDHFQGGLGYTWVMNLGIAGCAIIAGVFGSKGQRGPGFLALIVGVLSIILGLVGAALPDIRLSQYSFFGYLGVVIPIGLTIEAILMTVGGLVIVVSGED
ncbi:MAG: hypothetical protein HWN66_17915 [Candidatus Helarchaeota archaeon]|nr:hypothetical protein [Candidatus Helarchaeota archaeon]